MCDASRGELFKVKRSCVDTTQTLPLISYNLLSSEKVITLQSKDIPFTLNTLKYHINYQYKLLTCISGVDFMNSNYRFCVAYDILSLLYNDRIRIKTFVNEITSIDSSIDLYVNSD